MKNEYLFIPLVSVCQKARHIIQLLWKKQFLQSITWRFYISDDFEYPNWLAAKNSHIKTAAIYSWPVPFEIYFPFHANINPLKVNLL